jgi:hypothetical protein
MRNLFTFAFFAARRTDRVDSRIASSYDSSPDRKRSPER